MYKIRLGHITIHTTDNQEDLKTLYDPYNTYRFALQSLVSVLQTVNHGHLVIRSISDKRMNNNRNFRQ